MRLIAIIIWCIAALCWLPWAAVVLRFAVDLILGTPFDQSNFLAHAFVPIRSIRSWLGPYIIQSWYPICAVLSILLSHYAWRIYAYMLDGLVPRSRRDVILSTFIPPLALWMYWKDTRQSHEERNQEMEEEVRDARQQIESN